jgi:competence protein ComEC
VRRIVLRLSDCFFEETDNFILWLVAFFAAGTAYYFSLAIEPDWCTWLGLSLLSLLIFFCSKNNTLARLLFLIIFCFSIAVVNASLRTISLSSSRLDYSLKNAKIVGKIIKLTNLDDGKRLVIKISSLKTANQSARTIPKIVQVTVRNDNNILKVGQKISAYVILHPPSKILFPNKYDFSRHAYFSQIDANGFLVSKIKIIQDVNSGSFSNFLEGLRGNIYNELQKNLGGQYANVAAALMIGEQTSVSLDILNSMRKSGLSHVLSVSGVHLSLVSIICFFAIRFLLSNFVFFAQRYNTKKIAAIISFFVSLFYLLISGMQIATLRSFIMVAFIIIAVLVDRENDARRSVCFSALIILFFMPESIFHPSFQMSFSAVLGLVSFYEIYISKVLLRMTKERDIFSRIKLYFYGAVVSSLIAGFSTAMFVLYNFNNYSHYSVLANLLAAPIVSFFIMPGVVLTFLLMPIGLVNIGLWPVEFGIKLMLKISDKVSSISGAMSFLPTIPSNILLLFVFGFLWLTLWQKSWRYLGAIPLVLSLFLLFTLKFPSLIIDAKYGSVLMKEGDELVRIGGYKRYSDWYANQWLSLTDTTNIKQLNLENKQIKQVCNGFNIAIKIDDSKKWLRNLEQITISSNQSLLTVTQEDLKNNGSYFVYLDKDGLSYEYAINKNIHRPWS